MTEETNGRADDELFDLLHGMQCEALTKYLKDLKAGEAEYTPAMFAQINKFLKDNGIDRPVKAGDPEDLLADELDDFEEDNILPFDQAK